MELGPDADRMREVTFHYGKGCDRCHHTGYRGRTGVFEIMTVDDPIREAILKRASTADIREAAIRGGMRTLRESGLAALASGRTTIEEVLRETLR
jgi:type IV pilus assembly protein PilB